MIIALAATAAVALILVTGQSGFWAILILNAVVQLSLQAMMPLVETIAMRGVKYGGLDYGRMRLWGSLSFVLATYACGMLVERLGVGVVVWFLLAGVGGTFVTGILLPRGTSALQASGVASAPVTSARADFIATVRLITSPALLWFLLASGAVQAAHALFYTFGVVHWRSLGLSSAWIGSLWAISIAVEMLLFAGSAALIRKFGVWNLVALGAAASVVRWTAMAFNPSLPWLVLLQLLHAVTYAGTHIGAMHFIRDNVPEAQAGMAQAINVTLTTGLMMGLAQVLAGQTYDRYGGLSYLGMAAVAGFGLSIALWQKRRPVVLSPTM